MDRRDRAVIDHYCDDFSSRINMTALWPRLIENKVFNVDDVNVPSWEGKFADQYIAREILLTIKTRGPRAYNNLILSLHQTNQRELADILQARKLFATDNRGNPGNNDPSSNLPIKDDFHNYLQSSAEPLRIAVRKATEFLDGPEHAEPRYHMRSNPRGRVLLITNITFLAEGSTRKAAEHDEANLKDLFEQMGFSVTAKRDLTGAEIKAEVESFSRKNWKLIDSCFVIISAHGGESERDGFMETEIKGTDYGLSMAKKVYCNDICEYFTAENCKDLIKKPKVVIFQACRGEGTQALRIATDGIRRLEHPRNCSDMLVVHSTLPGHVAYRDIKSGSWFIQILCEVFMNHAYNHSLRSLFNMIDRRLANLRDPDEGSQTSTVQSIGFNKLCYLNPGLFEDENSQRVE